MLINERKDNLINELTSSDRWVKPACPFCGLPIARPTEQSLRRPLEMPVGSCNCGAVYAYDATGHNLGSAFSEALVFACNMDWDLAWNLLPGEDYCEDLLEKYDIQSHYIIPAGSYEGRRISGALYFIRMHNDIQEVVWPGVQEKLAKARSKTVSQPAAVRQNKGLRLNKQEIAALVENYQLEPLLETATHDNTIISCLQRMLYTGDELLRLKTADALGRVCAAIAKYNPALVSRLLQRLFTSITDAGYGTSNWGAIDAIGEVIANSPDEFSGYLPFLFKILEIDDSNFRPTALRALGVIARVRPDLITKTISYFVKFACLDDPQTRGNAVWLIKHLATPNSRPGSTETRAALKAIRGDQRLINIYEKGVFEQSSIGQLATQALARLE
ncbi:hypothetical protein SPSYN_00716 [Sporotomaculum syntrophicum]|uniref:Uncharacterized protein n=1 Tax=Sporotomaculum syntrophicum TaxID=182264 RepID=A0A9D3AZL6_9FIRM|nr:DVU0298 family protein [Sporotomaculum syntrophicum]KAF1085978.1 hypothetical protein SPSYN_00716 [Sporotomaculum syntrophicum]